MGPRRDSLWRPFWVGVVLLGALAMIEGTGAIRFGRAGVAPDLVLGAVIAWAFLNDSVHGAVWGFTGGLFLDGISTGPFPLFTVALTCVGLVVGIGRLSLYADERVWAMLAGFGGAVVFYLVIGSALWLSGWRAPLLDLGRLVLLPTIALDTLFVLLLLPFLKAISNRLVGRVMEL